MATNKTTAPRGEKQREMSSNKPSSKLMVAAIDFGTTYSGWAFSFKNDFTSEPTKAKCKHWNSGKHISLKAPTTVLIKPDGKTIDSFGYEAEDKYAELIEDEEDYESYYYFQRFKMLLYDNKTLKRTDTLEDINGNKLAAKTVFSLVIGFLKDDLLKEANLKTSGVIKTEEIQWVLTVPAIWNARAKQFMRECAVEAGISSEDLMLALEPEAASLYCKFLEIHNKKEGTSDGSMLSTFEPGTQYMIVDAGGGTVDVVIHQVREDGSLEEISASSGGNWGGTKVDNAFLKLVSEIYGDDYFFRLKKEHMDDYVDLLREIEIKKRTIKPDMESKLKLKIPAVLNEMYVADKKQDVSERIARKEKLKGRIAVKRDKIMFDPKLMDDMFSKTIGQIIGHLKALLGKVCFKGTDSILMVGGFSESVMLFSAVQNAFKKYKVMLPSDAGLSVLKGAVIYGHSKKNVDVRVSPFTYGISMRTRYDPARYDESRKYTDIDGKEKVKGAFTRLIKINEAISITQETDAVGCEPLYSNSAFTLKLFASTEADPLYVDDPSCFPVGDVSVDCRDDDGNVGGADVSIKFGGSEIETRAVLKSNKKLTTATFNLPD